MHATFTPKFHLMCFSAMGRNIMKMNYPLENFLLHIKICISVFPESLLYMEKRKEKLSAPNLME